MKKLFFIAIIFFTASSLKAQLADTKWKGILQLESPTDVIFDFKKDTLYAITAADNMPLETMTYTITDGVLSITKINGQSECGYAEAKYKVEMKDDELVFTVASDDCSDRSGVLDGTRWKKQ